MLTVPKSAVRLTVYPADLHPEVTTLHEAQAALAALDADPEHAALVTAMLDAERALAKANEALGAHRAEEWAHWGDVEARAKKAIADYVANDDRWPASAVLDDCILVTRRSGYTRATYDAKALDAVAASIPAVRDAVWPHRSVAYVPPAVTVHVLPPQTVDEAVS